MADVRSENRGRTDREQPQRAERESGQQQQVTRSQPSRGISTWRDPFSMVNDLQREMERLFGNFGFGPMFSRELDRGAWSPQIEMFERNGKLVVSADLPGLKKDDVKVELSDNVLTIEGERKDERRDEKGGWSERRYGHFIRSIALPEGINSENANATFNNGVLEITLDAPRQQQRGRKIEVK
jgi:HSP20 family protein